MSFRQFARLGWRTVYWGSRNLWGDKLLTNSDSRQPNCLRSDRTESPFSCAYLRYNRLQPTGRILLRVNFDFAWHFIDSRNTEQPSQPTDDGSLNLPLLNSFVFPCSLVECLLESQVEAPFVFLIEFVEIKLVVDKCMLREEGDLHVFQ